jgi:hypothetical protein
LNWFQTQWKHYPNWVAKAQKSLKKVFDDYIKQEAATNNNKLWNPPPLRRKLSANDLYAWVTAINTHLLTGNKNKRQQQRQRRVGQVDKYFEALYTNLNTTNESDILLLEHLYNWWQRVRRSRYSILFKITTNYLAVPCTSCDCKRAFSST